MYVSVLFSGSGIPGSGYRIPGSVHVSVCVHACVAPLMCTKTGIKTVTFPSVVSEDKDRETGRNKELQEELDKLVQEINAV